jgi:isopenicillin-N epimerase
VPSDRSHHYLIDPSVVFLNHGSFGACARPVFAEYQRLQLEMEHQPVRWLQREADTRLATARVALAEYVGCAPDEVVYFPNPTTAINMVARSLALEPGDEVLTTDHEYGALDRTWRVVCAHAGAHWVKAPLPLPIRSFDDVVERVWAARTDRTKVLFISHLTSATAMRFPVEELVRRARAEGILTIVDGAHVPGHLPLHLGDLGADIYTGACHKWMCAPKGSAFLYARRDVQHLLKPLVVSWGWEAEAPSGSAFVDHHEWQGTRDLSAYLATPAAIEWTRECAALGVPERCHRLLVDALARIDELTGLGSVYPDHSTTSVGQLGVARLPDLDTAVLKARLFDEHRIEVPVHRFQDQPLIRVSIADHTGDDDVDALIGALAVLLPELATSWP